METLPTPEDTKAVFEILMRQLTVQSAQLTEDARLQEDLGADSLDKMEIIMALEECFGFTVPDERAEPLALTGMDPPALTRTDPRG